MYVHFTTAQGADSIVVHSIADVDSIVYYGKITAYKLEGRWQYTMEEEGQDIVYIGVVYNEDGTGIGYSGITPMPVIYSEIIADYSFTWSLEQDKLTRTVDGETYISDVVITETQFTVVTETNEGIYTEIFSRLPFIEQGINWNTVVEGEVQANALTDADGNSYSAVKIGEQTWMAENLQVNIARVDTTDGVTDGICGSNDVFVWDNTDNSIYGKFYSWQAALKACPVGWHLPSDEEWKSLEIYLGMSETEADIEFDFRGTAEGGKLKATSGWAENGNGTDDYGFTALADGRYKSDDISVLELQDSVGFWWSSTKYFPEVDAYYRGVIYNTTTILRAYCTRSYGHSVRCIKD